MKLVDILNQRREQVLENWFENVLKSYSADSFKFFKNKKDRFNNPVGNTLWKGLPVLLDSVIGKVDKKEVSEALDAIVRIRAVQEFTPAQALNFVLVLKKNIEKATVDEIDSVSRMKELLELFERIDNLTLLAFNLYDKCREKIFQIRTDALQRQMFMRDKLSERGIDIPLQTGRMDDADN